MTEENTAVEETPVETPSESTRLQLARERSQRVAKLLKQLKGRARAQLRYNLSVQQVQDLQYTLESQAAQISSLQRTLQELSLQLGEYQQKKRWFKRS